jgi:hypothetical protein
VVVPAAGIAIRRLLSMICPFHVRSVTTADGYVLQIQRIPHKGACTRRAALPTWRPQ